MKRSQLNPDNTVGRTVPGRPRFVSAIVVSELFVGAPRVDGARLLADLDAVTSEPQSGIVAVCRFGRLSGCLDQAATYIDELVASGKATSRASAIDKMVRRTQRRERAQADALVYARQGEDPELAGMAEWVAFSMKTRGLEVD